MQSIFDYYGEHGLPHYLNLCWKVRKFSLVDAYQMAVRCIKYYRGDQSQRDALFSLMRLENRWYESLEKGEPDYSVYDDDCYISDVWACWTVYSRKYLLAIQKSNSLEPGASVLKDIGPARLVIDLGCGPGYTTAALKEIFPEANVVGTNLQNTMQYAVASLLGAERRFSVLHEVDPELGRADLIFASEYFEHIEEPVAHLIEVIKACSPRRLLIANAFNTRSVGHFDFYNHGARKVSGEEIGRLFNNTLKGFGYEKAKTKLWNNRPAYWRMR